MIKTNVAMDAPTSTDALLPLLLVAPICLFPGAFVVARRRLLVTKTFLRYSLPTLSLLRRRGIEPFGQRHGHAIPLTIIFFGALAFIPTCIRAQVPDPVNAAQAPIPGAGHHYIGTGGEIVNPADGSTSFSLPIQLPPSRGISMPLGIRYSGPEHRYLSMRLHDSNGIAYGGNAPLFWKEWEYDQGSTPLQLNGWSYELPWLTFAAMKTAQATNDYTGYTSICVGTGGYVFHGFDFVERSLALGNIYQDPENYHNTFPLCGRSMQSTSDRHGVLAKGQDLPQPDPNLPPPSPAVSVLDQSGTTYRFPGGTAVRRVGEEYEPPVNFGQLATEITDRNGNQFTLNRTGTGYGYTDALGRNIVSISGLGNDGDTITIPGMSSNIVLHWTDVSTSNGTGVSGRPEGTVLGCIGSSGGATTREVSEIDFPGAFPGATGVQEYRFSYEYTYGRVSQITFPGGGYVRYVWGLNSASAITEQTWSTAPRNTDNNFCRLLYDTPAITDRYVSHDGSTEVLHEHFAYSTTWSGSTPNVWSSKRTTVTSTDLSTNQTSVTIYNYGSLQPDQGALENNWMGSQVPVEQSVLYQDDSGHTLKSVNKTWYSIFTNDGTQTILENGQGTAVQRCFDANEQVTNVYEYGFQSEGSKPSDPGCYIAHAASGLNSGAMGPLKRQTTIVYQPFYNSVPSSGTHIVNAPQRVTIADGSGNIAKQTNYRYDENALQPSGAIHLANPGSTRANVTTLQAMVNATSGVATTLSYFDTGQVYTTTDPCGNAACGMASGNHTTTYSYADNYLTGTGVPPGQTHANLTQVTRPNTGTAHIENFIWGYADGQIRSSSDENGRFTNYQYTDPLGRLTQVDYPNLARTTVSYDDSIFSSSGNTPNYVVSQTIAAGVAKTIQTVFDGMGNIIHTVLTSDPDCITGDRIDITYDGWAQVHSASNPYCKTSDSTYGVTTNSYDIFGRTVAIRHPDGTVRHTAFVGAMSTVTDETGVQHTSVADSLGRLVGVAEFGGDVHDVTPSSGQITVTGNEQSVGTLGTRATGIISISGVSSPTQSVSLGSALTYNYSFPFSAPGEAAMIASAIAQNLQGSGLVTATVSGTTVYITAVAPGAAGNYPMSMTGFSGSGGGLSGGTDGSATEDAGTVSVSVNGLVASAPYGSGSTVGSVASDLVWRIEALGLPVSVSLSGSTITINGVSGGANSNYSVSTSSTWNTGVFSGSSFQICLTSSACPNGASNGTLGGGSDVTLGNSPTFYRYDTLGNLLRVDQNGNDPNPNNWRTRLFTYDALSRLTVATNPESGVISYFYDANGNLLQKVLPTPNQLGAAQHTISYCYDALNRINGKAYSWQTCQNGQLPSGTAVVSYHYDTGINGTGRLTNLTNSTLSESYQYDTAGDIVSQTTSGVANSTSYTTSAVYDMAGNLTSLTYPSGRHLTNTYSAVGLTGVNLADFNGTSVNRPYASSIAHTPSGAMTGITYGNGVVDTTEYNSRMQYENLAIKGSGQTFLQKTYGWYPNGNVSGIADGLKAARNQSFGYDQINRLITASQQSGGFNQTYTYDVFGNLTQHGSPVDTSGFSFSTTNQMIGGSIVYDAAGNMITTNTGQGLSYNPENQIVSLNNGTTTYYTYGPRGERIRKDLPAGAYTDYVHFGGAVLAERNEAGDWTDYIYAEGKRIARVDNSKQEVQIKGTDTAVWQYTWWKLLGAPPVTVGAGDKLYFAQYQQGAAEGGVALLFQDGSNSADAVKDQDGSYANLDLVSDKWHSRIVDLSQYAGKTIVGFYVGNDTHGPVGAWEIRYADMVLVQADSTVYPIYTGQSAVNFEYVSVNTPGVTGLVDTVIRDANVGAQTLLSEQYYHQDHLGSSRMITSGGGWPIWRGIFSPFGQEIGAQPTINHYKFAGMERDDESGLDYFGARYYSSNLGHFTSPDWSEGPSAVPYANLMDPQSLNLYSYVRNNPMSHADIDGHVPGYQNGCLPDRNCDGHLDSHDLDLINLGRSWLNIVEVNVSASTMTV